MKHLTDDKIEKQRKGKKQFKMRKSKKKDPIK